MTTVIVDAGACGYTVTIKVEKTGDGKIVVSLETECETVMKLLEEIAVLDRLTPLTALQNNPVYRAAGKHLRHPACVVPSAILKAVEVEAGLNVPKDALIRFVKD